MTAWRYIWASLRHFRRVHLAVALGVAVTTAVITGALLVGDSMRGSLRKLALEGVGRIDVMLLAEHPFREELVSEWSEHGSFEKNSPLLLMQGAAEFRDAAGDVHRATQLQVIGAAPSLWRMAPSAGETPTKDDNTIALTRPVAEELGVKIGDTILLRVPLEKSLPAESTLGEKEETTASRRLQVVAILSEADQSSFARFSLRPSQQPPRNVFVPLATLQDLLDLKGRVNAAAIELAPTDEESQERLAAIESALYPKLEDYGLTVKEIALDPSQPPYVHVSADRLVLSPHLVETAKTLFNDQGLQPVVTYLANRISIGDRSIPYSTVAGVDSTDALGPLFTEDGKPLVLAADEVALNDWAAERLHAKVGDSVHLAWYQPETMHGRLAEAAPLELKLRAIVPLADGSGKPTLAADPHFAPELPGVTDKESIDQWKLPFELVEPIGNEDEDYWRQYRTTPKAFISHDLAAKLWSTRWGTESVLRIPPRAGSSPTPAPSATKSTANELRDKLKPAAMGMNLLPVRQNALAAANGTTPFDGLFLGFSFFLMASAAMLTALLFRLGIEQRASEAGLLLAAGLPLPKVRRLLLTEAAIVSAVGALIGIAAGIGYGALMVHGLNTWWLAATVTPFMELHATPRSLAIGFFAGLIIALLTIAWSLRKLASLPIRQLMSGDAHPPLRAQRSGLWTTRALPLACVFASIALAFSARNLEGEAQAGAFMTSGALVLVGALLAIRGKLRETIVKRPKRLTLDGLAARNARRNPGRTMLSLALAATASFLIVALSAFRLAPTDRGVGGFDLLASADLPLVYDLNSAEGRRQLGFSNEDSAKLSDADIVAFRVHAGENASCLNLYKPTQPRVLGAPLRLGGKSDFAWAATAAKKLSPPGDGEDGWGLLDADLGKDENGQPVVPMVLDRSTALYSLQLYGVGQRMTMRDGQNRPVTLEIVGLLANSVLQGDVIISEANFLRLFPEESGQRFFLIRDGKTNQSPTKLASLLETQLEDFGFDAVDARSRLAELLAVQNTYLSTFQSLGALGLLLGVVGLAVAQLRSVLERRGELALMQATGFRRRRLAWMVLAENLVLLVGGLGIGCIAALVAVLPHAVIEQAGTPWATLAFLLAIVAIAGTAAAWLASRFVLRAPLLPALRGE